MDSYGLRYDRTLVQVSYVEGKFLKHFSYHLLVNWSPASRPAFLSYRKLRFYTIKNAPRGSHFGGARFGYIFSIPFVVTFALFTLYPIIYTVLIGFTDFKGLGATTFNFLDDPLQNYKTILESPTFRTALGNTFRMWGWNFLPQILLALLLASIFTNRRHKVKGQGFFKVVFYMPNIITAATVAILFGSLFGYPMGPINDLLMSLGIIDKPFFFLQSKSIARGVVSFIQFWMWYGYTMIVLISGILGISPEIYEAAEIDGATSWDKFRYVTLPIQSFIS